MRRFMCVIIAASLYCLCSNIFAGNFIVENFENYTLGGEWPRVPFTEIVDNCGIEGRNNKCLRVSYVPQSNGSARLTKFLSLPKFDHYVLSYQVYFEPGFEFVLGGKLPGLGSENPTSGCNPVESNSWSSRFAWQAKGYAKNYFYGQDRSTDCGDGQLSTAPVFTTGKWYDVEMNLKLNSEENPFDGYLVTKVDGVVVSADKNLRFRNSYEDASLIDNVMFSTFFGGNTAEWAPSKTVYALFDNFKITPVGDLTPELQALSSDSLPMPKPQPPTISLSSELSKQFYLRDINFNDISLDGVAGKGWLNIFPFTDWIKGFSEGRMALDSTITREGSGKSLKVFFPKGISSRNDGGIFWQSQLDSVASTYNFSYWMYLEEDFIYGDNGGKLPGLSHLGEDTSKEWRAYLSWRKTGQLYLVFQTSSSYRQVKLTFKDKAGKLNKGQWQKIRMELGPNTNGLSDGAARVWVNDVKVGEFVDLSFGSGNVAGDANKLLFNAYMEEGSDSSEISNQDQWVWFDDIQIWYNSDL